MKSRGRRWRRIFVGLCLAALALWLGVPPLLRAVVRHRLQAMVSQQLNARLEMGGLEYKFPYGVVVSDALLVTQTPQGESVTLLDVPQLKVQFAKLPFGRGPLVIKEVEINDPSVHLVRTAEGLVGHGTLVRENPDDSASPSKLSDVFELTHFAMHGGKFIYEDRTAANAVPLAWKDLNVELNTQQQSNGNYAYKLQVDNAPLATLEAEGSANIDDLSLKIQKCALAVAVDPNAAQSPLPAEVQQTLRQWAARGKIGINLSADFPLRHPADGVYHCAVDLSDASAAVPGWRTPLDKLLLKMDLDHPAGASTTTQIDLFEADAGGARVRLDGARAAFNSDTRAWQFKLANGHIDAPTSLAALPPSVRDQVDRLHLTGALDFSVDASGPSIGQDLARATGTLDLRPQNLTLRPPGFALPISGMVDTKITFANGSALVQEVRAASGDNLLYIKSAGISLTDLPAAIRITDAGGCLTLGPSRNYPPLIADDLADIGPVGPFFFSGDFSLDRTLPQPKVDYHVSIRTTRGRLRLADSGIEFTSIDAMTSVTPAGLTIDKLNASVFDGSLSATGNMKFSTGLPYAVKLSARDIDLQTLAAHFTKPGDTPSHLAGQAVLSANLTGIIPPDDSPPYKSLRGSGEFAIRHGDIWEIPLMKSIAGAFSKDSLTIGQAAAQFEFGDAKIHFDHAVANSPLLGIEGSGDVGYDGKLNFSGVADPFGNWGDRAGGNNPLATVVGAVQRTVNLVTRHALYEIVVTGTVSAPKTSAVPVPIVAHGVQNLLGLVRKQDLTTDLLGELHKLDDAAAAKLEQVTP